MFEPDKVHFVTFRTIQGRFLLRPSMAVNLIIGGVLAHAMKRFHIKLFNFVFLSNHGHLLLQAPEGMLPPFMQFLLSNVARKLGSLHDWHDKLWARRYSSEPVLDDDAVNGRMIYIF